tara:strand:+ start:419 stop:661 length:243 start_codon:yes stop_codon:yes gene_type:complete
MAGGLNACILLNTAKPATMTAPASTIKPTGMTKAEVATVAQSRQMPAASIDNWLVELQSGQHEDINETPERMCNERDDFT